MVKREGRRFICGHCGKSLRVRTREHVFPWHRKKEEVCPGSEGPAPQGMTSPPPIASSSIAARTKWNYVDIGAPSQSVKAVSAGLPGKGKRR